MSSTVALRPAPGKRLEVRESGMLVATKTVSVTDEYGQPERLIAGQTFVRAPHFLTQTYPELFAPADKRRAKARRRAAEPRRAITGDSATPAEAPAMWKPLVRLDTRTAPTFTVRLWDKAYDSMTGQAFAQRGTVETGGALFGPPALEDHDVAEVAIAGEPGPAARHERGRMHVDLEHIRRQAGELFKSGSEDRWVGHWHTHPTVDGGQPSDGDLRFFAADCREFALLGQPVGHYIGLILTPTWDHDRHSCERVVSWASPTIHAWHMQAVSDDQFICTRATVAR